MVNMKNYIIDKNNINKIKNNINNKPIVLIGMMGSGKTSVGKLISKILGFSFIDSDLEIERKTRKTIPSIFKNEGEKRFRELEEKIFLEIFYDRKLINAIISSGGGAFENSVIRKLTNKKAITVWLDADIKTIHHRVTKRKNSKRPLLYDSNICFTLTNILKKREKNYSLAHVIAKVEKTSKKQMAYKIIKLIDEYLTNKDA